MTIVDFNILITFDLNYASSSDYKSVNAYLEGKGIEPLSQKGYKLPSNTYIGKQSEVVGRLETELEVAKKIKNNIFTGLKRNIGGMVVSSVVFVMVTPAHSTSYSCSKPIDA